MESAFLTAKSMVIQKSAILQPVSKMFDTGRSLYRYSELVQEGNAMASAFAQLFTPGEWPPFAFVGQDNSWDSTVTAVTRRLGDRWSVHHLLPGFIWWFKSAKFIRWYTGLPWVPENIQIKYICLHTYVQTRMIVWSHMSKYESFYVLYLHVQGYFQPIRDDDPAAIFMFGTYTNQENLKKNLHSRLGCWMLKMTSPHDVSLLQTLSQPLSP